MSGLSSLRWIMPRDIDEKHKMFTVGYVRYVQDDDVEILVVPTDGSIAVWDTEGDPPGTTAFTWSK